MIEEGGVSLHQSHKQFLEKASNSFVFLFPSVKSMRCALPSFMALTIVNRCQDPRDSAASRWCAASSSPPRHISLCKYITSTSTSSEVWTYTECLVWFGLAIDQWELRWLSIIFRPMRRELTKFNKSKLSAVQDPEQTTAKIASTDSFWQPIWGYTHMKPKLHIWIYFLSKCWCC